MKEKAPYNDISKKHREWFFSVLSDELTSIEKYAQGLTSKGKGYEMRGERMAEVALKWHNGEILRGHAEARISHIEQSNSAIKDINDPDWRRDSGLVNILRRQIRNALLMLNTNPEIGVSADLILPIPQRKRLMNAIFCKGEQFIDDLVHSMMNILPSDAREYETQVIEKLKELALESVKRLAKQKELASTRDKDDDGLQLV